MQTKAAAPADIYDHDEEQRRLLVILAAIYLLMLRETHRLMADTFNLDPATFAITDAAIASQVALASERVALIDATTGSAIGDLLEQGRALGLTNAEIVTGSSAHDFGGLLGLYRETWADRPATIAANEAHAGLLGASQQLYAESGLFDRQLIRDGTTHDQPCADRNGTVVPITEPVYQLHPNCRVITRPIRSGAKP